VPIKRFAVLLLAAVSLFLAQTDQHFDMMRQLTDVSGKPIMQPPPSDSKAAPEPVILSDIVQRAIFAPCKSDEQISPTEKGKWLEDMRSLAKRVYRAKDVILTPEEITLLKYRIANVGFSNEISGAALELFDPPKKAK
jgi:hypothetical protein